MDNASTTSNSQLKSALFTSLAPELKGHGFLLKPAKDRFFRQRAEVTDLFQLVCLDGRPGYRIQPHIGVRIERVESIFHQASGYDTKYQKDTPTMGSSIGILQTGDSRSCEFLMESESEVGIIVGRIVGVFLDFALPYFERWQTLSVVDTELNSKPGERTSNRPLAWERCSTGLIVAKLVGRSDYDQLVALYTEVISKDNNGFYLKRFRALVKVLESVEAGSGLPK